VENDYNSSTQCKISMVCVAIDTDLGTEMTQNKSKQPSYFCSDIYIYIVITFHYQLNDRHKQLCGLSNFIMYQVSGTYYNLVQDA
jgi:hypothetical protein